MKTYLSWPKQTSILSLTLLLNIFSVWPSNNVLAENKYENNRQGWPSRRISGGSRRCGVENTDHNQLQQCLPLIALVSEGLAQTTQTLPSLWFYLPPIPNSDQIVLEFVLRDQEDQLVYEATFKPTHQGEMTSFQLTQSQTFKGLVEGKAYHWYLSVIHKAQDRSHDDVVEGWLQRVPLNPSVAQQLKQATPIEKVRIYQQAELWPEAIATMASLKQIQPNDPIIGQKWQQLLTALELSLPTY
ncbi:DUF928 domain-containing protein [Chroococcus sp. FPU101]|uniref:DUF928 domain-containing protein n=1 Tax=Chroococcus sp. FPU101 TaxID=1974212 RepID=UPI001A8C13CF|nr:DUF928 domain-containing protein [Chroococcus sp. FPU101]GFE67508.1 protein of unknown function DUF928 [Chroococcus sp. FPU101]